MTSLNDRMDDTAFRIVPSHDGKGIPDYYARSKADNRTKRIIGAVKPKAISAQLDPLWQDKVKQWGDQAFEDLGIAPRFDMYNEAIKDHLEDFSSDRITQINDTTRDKIANALGAGVDAGEGVDDLAKRIQDVFEACSTSRAELIARTETCRSANFASLQGYKQTGLVGMKKWLATMDDKTRDTHIALGEQDPIPIDDDFEIEGYSGQAPGDFGEPEQDCNCRCAITPVSEDAPGPQPEELEDDEDGKSARRGLSKAMRAMTDAARWKRFDAHLTTWEDDAVKALRKGFAEQKAAALAALRS